MSNPPTTLLIAIPAPLRQAFDYLPPDDCKVSELKPGLRVKIPFHHRVIIGILLKTHQQVSPYKLKKAIAVIDKEPVITADILQLCEWAADYYHHPFGDVLDTALPTLLRQGKPLETAAEFYWQLTPAGRELNLIDLKKAPRQIEVLQWLHRFPHGVTAQQLKAEKLPVTILKTLQKKGYVAWQESAPIAAPSTSLRNTPLQANLEQQQALATIQKSQGFHVFLLDGVTGSGKTEVYLQAMLPVLERQQQVLVLVPEIGLTPQTMQRFQERFQQKVVALHSGLSDKERLNAWLGAKDNTARIFIGTRSAIFSPFAQLGLIIVDEEHDVSFKQQEGFRYHARDLAIKRAHTLQIPIILGSATPSLETIGRTEQGRYTHLQLTTRAGGAGLPQAKVIDIRNQHLEAGLSPQLLALIGEHLQQQSQVMIFLNRRGFAPVLMCHGCGWVAICKSCDARMTYHQDPRRLHCHHCDRRRSVMQQCPECAVKDLQVVGLGTERLEEALQKHFPQYSIARIDRDSTQRKGSMEKLLASIHSGEHQILIGTQMLAKGHHFPNVTLVGVVDADGGFFSADFRAVERMGQLILQVAGRAGRVEKPGTVAIQTHHPDHPLLQQLLRENYQHFARLLLQERENAGLPPYSFLALFRAEGYQVADAEAFLAKINEYARACQAGVQLWGPVPAPMPRRAGRYRMQLLLQATQRPVLQRLLAQIIPLIDKLPGKQKVRWSLDVDPVEMF